MKINKSIVIHHHATIYIDPTTSKMYMVSFIGRWVNEIANQFEKVGLLFHSTSVKSISHDTEVIGHNIEFIDLGLKFGPYDRFNRQKRIRNLCQDLHYQYDVLLIRGITPRQYIVYRSCKIKQKFFLLVGSLTDSRPKFILNYLSIYSFIMYWVRIFELRIIARKANILANSPIIVSELENNLNIKAKFLPTNSIKKSEISDFLQRAKPNIKVKLLFCGRVVKDKGIIELIKALHILNQSEKRYYLTIVGDCSPLFYKSILELPFYKNISDFLNFEGFVKFGEDLMNYYKANDIYILPSYHEGFPHSIWEAGATGIPVITTKVGGIPGLVSDTMVTFIETKSAEAIVNGVSELLNNWDLEMEKCKELNLRTQEMALENCVILLNEQVNGKGSN